MKWIIIEHNWFEIGKWTYLVFFYNSSGTGESQLNTDETECVDYD